jgi:hypothetical protein
MIIHTGCHKFGYCNKSIFISSGFDTRVYGIGILTFHAASVRRIDSWVLELVRNSEHNFINLIVLLKSSRLEKHVKFNFVSDTSFTIVERFCIESKYP